MIAFMKIGEESTLCDACMHKEEVISRKEEGGARQYEKRCRIFGIKLGIVEKCTVYRGIKEEDGPPTECEEV